MIAFCPCQFDQFWGEYFDRFTFLFRNLKINDIKRGSKR